MFETLSKGFRAARNRLTGVTELDEANLEPALRDVRLSLLEADVELGVVKRFLERVKTKIVGETIQNEVQAKGRKIRVGPAERFIKACQDELVAMMASEGPVVAFAPKPQPTVIMMVGLQGSGKTTTSGKLARLRRLVVFGPAVFIAVGFAGIFMSGWFLSYPPDYAKPIIVAVEAALALSIAVILGLLVAGPAAEPPKR